MAYDFEVEKGLTLGEWLYQEIDKACVIERDGWAPERVGRVADRLQASRPPDERLDVAVPWMSPTALTAPGRHIYFSRALLERCPDDDCVALVVAHELAHHDLGHVRLFPHWLAGLTRMPNGWLAAAALHAVERRLYGPENECAADRRGLELCLAAGYNGESALYLVNILEEFALVVGDRDIVFGPDPESEDELAEDAPWQTKLRIWMWQRTRGYLPLQDRRAMLRKHLAALTCQSESHGDPR